MSLKQHINIVRSRISKSISIFYILSKQCLELLYFSIIHNYVNYANITWASTIKSKLEHLYPSQKHVACVCVCVCVCLFLLFHRKNFLRLQRCLGHTWGVRINNLVMRVLSYVLLPSSFISKFHISAPETKLQQSKNWRENDMIYCSSENMICIDIVYNPAPMILKPTSYENPLEIRRLL